MKEANKVMECMSTLSRLILILLLGSWIPVMGQQKEKTKPNIILIYADDLGYSDVGCYGREYGIDFIETPNLDRLANEGMKFTDAYASAPLCSPARAALLTGKTPARLGFEFVTKYEADTFTWKSPEWIARHKEKKLITPPYTLTLPLKEITLAEALKKEGYTTGIVGKWHVAPHYKKYLGWSPTYGPSQQGFDWTAETFGAHPYGSKNKAKKKNVKKGTFPADSLTLQAIEFLKQKQDPFFLYVSHYFVHTPIGQPTDWLKEKYRKKAGPEATESQINYAAFVETFDHYVGQLLDAIDSLGLSENTLVIFTSDNGGNPNYSYNRPFRGSKWNLYEGGIRVPMIVRWPSVVKKGSLSNVPVIQTDFMPTLLDIASTNNNDRNNAVDGIIDGRSILSVLKGESPPELNQRALYWHFPYYHPEGEEFYKAKSEIGIEDGYTSRTMPQSAIRKGRYKLMYFYDDNRVELYDLKTDPEESTDLSSLRPWDVNALKTELFNKLNDAHARFPRENIPEVQEN